MWACIPADIGYSDHMPAGAAGETPKRGTAAGDTKMTTTNINLIVNGTKVYTRKTTGRPYTHALVAQTADGKFQITNCSAKGPDSLHDDETRMRSRIIRRLDNPTWFVLPIVDNTVTLAA